MIRSTAHALAVLITSICLAACGDDGGSPAIDAPAADADNNTCAAYCSTITTNCANNDTQYSDQGSCMASCAVWGPGTPGEMAGNTRACRIYHAGAASGNPGLHCRHAGPGGDGACGGNCEGFCSLVTSVCGTQATPPYASMGACMTACAGFATTPPYSAAVTGGDSFACRLYHATAASVTPGLHCPHTAATSATCN